MKFHFFSVPISILCAFFYSHTLLADTSPTEKKHHTEQTPIIKTLLEDKGGIVSSLSNSIFGKNKGDELFYFPTHDEPFTPKKYGYTYEDVTFKSSDGTVLHGWFLPAKQGAKKAKATVVFSHGNAGSIAYHFGFASWFVPAGYNVFYYDYRGYGKSKGNISRKGMIEDVSAAFRYIQSRKDIDPQKLVSFAHSLGASQSIVALSIHPVKGMRAIITNSAFASYREMARLKAGKLGARITSDSLSPIDYIQKIPSIPLLMIHGNHDKIVPISQGVALFKKAKQPKTFFRVPGGGHNDNLRINRHEYRKKVLKWLDKTLAKK